MRNTLIGCCLGLAFAGLYPFARAYFDTGNALYMTCSSKTAFDLGHCLGTIVATTI